MNINEVLQRYAKPYNAVAEHGTPRYYIINKGVGYCYVLLFLPYLPYKRLNDNSAYIDAFYIASNTLYHTTKLIISELSRCNAKSYNGNLKALFRESDCGIQLQNTLIAIPPFGTKVALEAIEAEGDFEELRPSPSQTIMPVFLQKLTQNIAKNSAKFGCNGCNLCKISCPTSAFGGADTASYAIANSAAEGNFNRESCLRQAMDSYKTTTLDLTLLGNSILGCDICQRVCPYNADIAEVDMPSEIKDILRLDSLFNLISGGKKALEGLGKLIGFNYIRPQKLIYFALNAINSAEYAYYALPYLQSAEPIISNKATEVIKKFSPN